jgi:hypothetical protein
VTYFASCAGQPIVSGELMIPLVGMWTADLHLATDTPVSGQVTIVIGNLTLLGTVYRSEPYGGQTHARIVAGYGGWRTTIDSQGYGHSAGLKMSTVLQDAAAACGEKITVTGDQSIGNAYTRADTVASDVLWQMVAQGFVPAWYVDASGTTQTKSWPTVAVQTPFTVTNQDPDKGLVVIATEDYVSWMPGCTFTSPELAGSFTSGGVHYVWTDDGQFRFEVLTGTTDRFLGALQAFVARQIAPTRFYGRYEYTISSPSATTIDGSPTDDAIGLPDLQNVPLDGDSISSYVPPSGGICHIQFLNGLPTQPICVWTSGNPSSAKLLGGPTPVARIGDTIQAFLPPTLPVVGDVGGSPFTGTITVVNPITGTITTGSSQVSSA